VRGEQSHSQKRGLYEWRVLIWALPGIDGHKSTMRQCRYCYPLNPVLCQPFIRRWRDGEVLAKLTGMIKESKQVTERILLGPVCVYAPSM